MLLLGRVEDRLVEEPCGPVKMVSVDDQDEAPVPEEELLVRELKGGFDELLGEWLMGPVVCERLQTVAGVLEAVMEPLSSQSSHVCSLLLAEYAELKEW